MFCAALGPSDAHRSAPSFLSSVGKEALRPVSAASELLGGPGYRIDGRGWNRDGAALAAGAGGRRSRCDTRNGDCGCPRGNEFGARAASDYPGRFGLFAYLPLPDIDASLHEIEHAFDTLQADGVGLLTSYGNRWLGDSAFQPVFEELDRRHAIVYSHPTDGPCCHSLLPNTIPHAVEWNTDTSRAIWSVINDGTDRPPVTTPGPSMATRYKNIRFVWSHGGGTLLGLVGRFLGHGGTVNVRSADLDAAPEPDSKLHHLRRFYYDTALSANRIQMQALKALVGGSQIVFGTDYPFMSALDTVEALRECGFNKDERATSSAAMRFGSCPGGRAVKPKCSSSGRPMVEACDTVPMGDSSASWRQDHEISCRSRQRTGPRRNCRRNLIE